MMIKGNYHHIEIYLAIKDENFMVFPFLSILFPLLISFNITGITTKINNKNAN